MSLDKILADVKPEGDTDPFKSLNKEEKETTSESSTQKEPEGEKPIQGENTDDDKTPFSIRWKNHAENLKAELEAKHQEEMAKLREEFDAKIPPKESGEKSTIPEWFKHLYGENEVAWQAYSENSQQEREQMKKDIIAEQEAKVQEAHKEEQKWNKWVEDGIDGLKILGLEFDRNALIKTMLDNPDKVSRDGNFDFNLGYKLYRESNPVQQTNSEARKKLADTATKSSPVEKSSKDFMTSNELRNKSWNQL